MKMTKEHYETIKSTIDSLDKVQIAKHKALKLGNDKEMRFRWDLFFACKLSYSFVQELYAYLNDEHIDTALRKIVKELKL